MQAEFATHGKAILIGEHSVVYGYNALCMPLKELTLTTTVAAQDEGPSLFTNNYHGLFSQAPEEYNGLHFLVDGLILDQHLPEKVSLNYEGEIPMERGLGSSAAVALGTVRAINSYYSLDMDEHDIVTWANKAENITHGSASGLDVATVKSDHLVSFNKTDGPQEITSELGAYLVISDTGQLGSTKTAVSQVREQVSTSAEKKSSMDRLGDLADTAIDAWGSHDINQLGAVFNRAQEILTNFSLSTRAIDRINHMALEEGAVGSKLSGSGLGGVVISLVRDSKTAQLLRQSLRAVARNVWIEAI
ncbi:MAG: mevalonate kinase [Bifidobacteriaceae bacterium]|nr:mevalonate kinase [Bifidobacteriaceae bacterium]MCI1915514.1 mevalonate kinase [Bifidobacteriaceae bacterium]